MEYNRLFQTSNMPKSVVIEIEEIEKIKIATYELDYSIDTNGNIYDSNMNSVSRIYKTGRAQVVLNERGNTDIFSSCSNVDALSIGKKE